MQDKGIEEALKKFKLSFGTPCEKCDEMRALTVAEVNSDSFIPDFIKELIVPILKDQREMQRKVAGTILLAYLRGKQEGEKSNG